LPNPDERDKVLLLLGTDYADLMAVTALVRGEPGEPIAEKTDIGWAYSGRIKNCKAASSEEVLHGASHVMRDICLANSARIIESDEPELFTKKEQHPLSGKIDCETVKAIIEDSEKLKFQMEKQSIIPASNEVTAHLLDAIASLQAVVAQLNTCQSSVLAPAKTNLQSNPKTEAEETKKSRVRKRPKKKPAKKNDSPTPRPDLQLEQNLQVELKPVEAKGTDPPESGWTRLPHRQPLHARKKSKKYGSAIAKPIPIARN